MNQDNELKSNIMSEKSFDQQEQELQGIPSVAEESAMSGGLIPSAAIEAGLESPAHYSLENTVSYETPEYTIEGLTLDEQEFFADAAYVAKMAQEANAPISLRAAAIANEMLAIDDEESFAADEEIAQGSATSEAVDEELPLSDRFGRGSRKILALLSVATALGAVAPAANAGGLKDYFNVASVEQGLGKIEQGSATYTAMRENRRVRDNKVNEIKNIEAQKATVRAQGGVNQEIGKINRSVGTSAQEQVLAANFEVQKAEFQAQREVLKEQFLKLENPTPAQAARYKADVARIRAAEVQADATFRTAVAQTQGQSIVSGAYSGVEAANVETTLRQLTQYQERLEDEIRSLDIQYRKLQLGGFRVLVP